jgi:NAD(P)-dependent dehydrogenase (short-subunit alcohol dehydrogenase family)
VRADLDGLGYRGARVVVVGCSTGIGAATVGVLDDLGAQVHTVSRNEPPVRGESFHPLDLRDPDAIGSTAEELTALGPIDHLFVCAGVPMTHPPAEVIQVNYFGVRQLVEAVAPAMVAGGSVGVVGSNTAFGWEGRLPELHELLAVTSRDEAATWCETHPEVLGEGFASYVLSKQALVAWVKHRAPSLAEQHRVRLNATLPGPTETPMVEEITSRTGREVFDRYPHPVLGHIPQPEAQAWPLLLLCSRLNQVVTGAVAFCDEGVSGGMLTGSIDLAALLAP